MRERRAAHRDRGDFPHPPGRSMFEDGHGFASVDSRCEENRRRALELGSVYGGYSTLGTEGETAVIACAFTWSGLVG
jgi:hypothetical protein